MHGTYHGLFRIVLRNKTVPTTATIMITERTARRNSVESMLEFEETDRADDCMKGEPVSDEVVSVGSGVDVDG